MGVAAGDASLKEERSFEEVSEGGMLSSEGTFLAEVVPTWA